MIQTIHRNIAGRNHSLNLVKNAKLGKANLHDSINCNYLSLENATFGLKHMFNSTPERYPDAGLTQNYCRTPDGDSKPWCLPKSGSRYWEYCSIPICQGIGVSLASIDLISVTRLYRRSHDNWCASDDSMWYSWTVSTIERSYCRR